jgi:hypothetical protein
MFRTGKPTLHANARHRLLGHAISEHFAWPIETAAGIMLAGLGAHVLWQLRRDDDLHDRIRISAKSPSGAVNSSIS